jgi:hypothetical protein
LPRIAITGASNGDLCHSSMRRVLFTQRFHFEHREAQLPAWIRFAAFFCANVLYYDPWLYLPGLDRNWD